VFLLCGKGLTTYEIVLLRQGDSDRNQENRFTGWTDVGRTEKGFAKPLAARVRIVKCGM